ncbi:MAG: redox-regulated ATPase YchF [Candidatus Aenigmarchaeota archaeon]|jgi:ribosome-binding ATPase YchF (GTP1/OBG family)|nr:redox-regulated ATPase YchF [Candidatus Aenigmarchaeota archaeon]
MIEIGLVGKPNAGKSSFLKAATLQDVKISPVPFTTLKPNIAIAYVTKECVCKEFNVKCNPKQGACINGIRFIPIELWDLPGIVPGAHEGKGLGLRFLDEARKTKALIHVVDFSGLTDEEGKPTENYDVEKDIEFVENEINAWFRSIIERGIEKYKSRLKNLSKEELITILMKQLSGLEVERKEIERALEICGIENLEDFARCLREISKPIIIVANKVDLESAQKNYERLKDRYKNIIPASAEAEIALRLAAAKGLIDYFPGSENFVIKGNLTYEQQKALELIKENVLKKFGSTGIQKALNFTVFEVLGYIVVYPVANKDRLSDTKGNILPDALLVRKGTTLKELAFSIHTEIGEKFICGIDARTKMRLSSEYELKDGDVIEIVHRA